MRTIKLTREIIRSVSYIFIECEPDCYFEKMIKSFPGRKWSKKHGRWYINDEESDLKNLIKYFRGRFSIDTRQLHNSIKEFNQIKGSNDSTAGIRSGYFGRPGVEVEVNNEREQLIIRFSHFYRPEWINELKHFGNLRYDRYNNEWTLPARKAVIDSVNKYFNSIDIDFSIRKAVKKKSDCGREKVAGDIRSRKLSRSASEAIELLRGYLISRRFSENTLGTYLAQLEFFFKYFITKAPCEITENDVIKFIENYIHKYKLSLSYQNQMISAIKTYYEISEGTILDTTKLKRPKKSRPLPKVLSKDEVSSLINGTRNIKHRLILSIIYACGLRRSELTNIKLSDLNRERSIIHIKEAKGMKDRVVPVSGKLWPKLDEYYRMYQPKKYLFEGQGGGQYSTGSVYRVFRTAMERAGINKDMGVHSLRHSYATHLHESGLDIRYIQELLGHQSSRTTEIYTHISRRDLYNFRSPLDDLDVI